MAMPQATPADFVGGTSLKGAIPSHQLRIVADAAFRGRLYPLALQSRFKFAEGAKLLSLRLCGSIRTATHLHDSQGAK